MLWECIADWMYALNLPCGPRRRSTKSLRPKEVRALFHVKQLGGKHCGFFNEGPFNKSTAGAETGAFPGRDSLLAGN